jgi:hypothetical protein
MVTQASQKTRQAWGISARGIERPASGQHADTPRSTYDPYKSI